MNDDFIMYTFQLKKINAIEHILYASYSEIKTID